MKKNHTIQWLDSLSEDQQVELLDLAIQERPKVVAARNQFQKEISEQRQQLILQANVRRETLKLKAQKERNELLEHHLITTSQELKQTMVAVDAENLSTQKAAKKLTILKVQVNIKKKILKNVHIPFSYARKSDL